MIDNIYRIRYISDPVDTYVLSLLDYFKHSNKTHIW